jgi:hypothetical protein
MTLELVACIGVLGTSLNRPITDLSPILEGKEEMEAVETRYQAVE